MYCNKKKIISCYFIQELELGSTFNTVIIFKYVEIHVQFKFEVIIKILVSNRDGNMGRQHFIRPERLYDRE